MVPKILTIMAFSVLISMSCSRQQLAGSQIQYDETALQDQNLTGRALDGADGEGVDLENDGDQKIDGGGSGSDSDGSNSKGGKTGGGDDGDDDRDPPSRDGKDDISVESGDKEIKTPESDIGPFNNFCSKNGSRSAGTTVESSNGVSVAVYDSSGTKVLSIDNDEEIDAIRDELVDRARFSTRKFSKVEDGTYYLALCDASMAGSCSVSRKFVEDFRDDFEELENAPRGIVGMAIDVRVRDGEVVSNGMASILLHDRSSGDAGCDTTNSPLVIDFSGNSITMSAPTKGVLFDISGDANPEKVSWPISAGAGFLALDINTNGSIESVHELFGNNTTGPDGATAKNGFLALAKHDQNGDQVIDAKDAVFDHLVLWFDENVNGTTEPNELVPLKDKVQSIALAYIEAYERDAFGNETRQRSSVTLANGYDTKMMFDLWFRTTK